METLKPVSKETELVIIAESWERRAAVVQVIDQQTLDATAELLQAIKSLRHEAEAHHRPVIAAAHAAHQAALAALARVDAPLAMAENVIKAKTAKFIAAKEAEKAEIQRQLDLQARREHEEALAARKREMDALEAARRQEQARLEAEQAEMLELELAAMEAAGATPEQVKAAILEAEAESGVPPLPPAPPPPPMPVYVAPVAPPTYRRHAGAGGRVTYSARVIDLPALIEAASVLPEAYQRFIIPHQIALNSEAKIQKEKFDVPGCELVKTTGITTRR